MQSSSELILDFLSRRYYNVRASYTARWFNIINWTKAAAIYEDAKLGKIVQG